jgi:hypothetical protein
MYPSVFTPFFFSRIVCGCSSPQKRYVIDGSRSPFGKPGRIVTKVMDQIWMYVEQSVTAIVVVVPIGTDGQQVLLRGAIHV